MIKYDKKIVPIEDSGIYLAPDSLYDSFFPRRQDGTRKGGMSRAAYVIERDLVRVVGCPRRPMGPDEVEEPELDYAYNPDATDGTAIYADQLGWCQRGQWEGIYASPMECMG